jgi:hypothetical protein
MSKFAVKKSGAKAKQEEAKVEAQYGGKGCMKHKREGVYFCSCKGELICDQCIPDHSGFEHQKTPVNEVITTFEQTVNSRMQESDKFYRIYRGTKAGTFFGQYVEFFETCANQSDNLRSHYDQVQPYRKNIPSVQSYVDNRKRLQDLKEEYKR